MFRVRALQTSVSKVQADSRGAGRGDHPLSRFTTRGMRLCGPAARDFVNEKCDAQDTGCTVKSSRWEKENV